MCVVPSRICATLRIRGNSARNANLEPVAPTLVVAPYDRHILAIECKASNSEVNSFKRINHEAVGKTRSWVAAFGRNQLVPAAILTGVFDPDHLGTAQSEGLALFWIHRLDDLQEFISATSR